MITGAVTMIMRPINLIASIYLLRILDPTDFGLVALAMLLVTTSYMFCDLGMGSALIHTSLDRGKAAFQSFLTSSIFSCLLFSVIYFNTGFFAQLLGAPKLQPILQCLAFYLLIDPASTIPISLLRKDLLFDKVGLTSFLGEISMTLTQVLMAFFGFGLWSLVIGRLVGSSVSTLSAWLLCPGWDWIKPKSWDKEIQRSLFSYGMQSTGSGAVSYIHSHFDDWLVGRMLGANALGFYSKAYEFTHQAMNRLGKNVLKVVFFPSFNKIQDDKPRLARAYTKSVRVVLLIIIPVAFGVMSLAPDIIHVLFGDKWMPMVVVLQIYAFAVLTRPISENSSSLFQAVGKPSYNLRAGLLLLAVMVPLSLILLPYGIAGVAIAVVIGHIVGVAFNIYQANMLVPGTARQTLSVMASMLVIGIIMACVLIVTKLFIILYTRYPENFIDLVGNADYERLYNLMRHVIPLNWLDFLLTPAPISETGLAALVVLGALVYFIAVMLGQRAFVMEILQMLLTIIEPKIQCLTFWKKR